MPRAQDQKPEQRRARIAEAVLHRGSVSPADLAAEFEVSMMTVHRDLNLLEERGVLRKARGGVTARPSGVFEANLAYRMTHMTEEKRAVARRAARFIEPGMAIILDDSTTALQLLPLLGAQAPLTVATNFLAALDQLRDAEDMTVMAFGGDYDRRHDSFLGLGCVQAIEAVRVDAVFVSTSAVAADAAFHQEARIVPVKRAMLAVAGRRYLLIDHTKLARRALHRLAPLTSFDAVIVDAGASPEAVAELEESGVTVAVAT